MDQLAAIVDGDRNGLSRCHAGRLMALALQLPLQEEWALDIGQLEESFNGIEEISLP